MILKARLAVIKQAAACPLRFDCDRLGCTAANAPLCRFCCKRPPIGASGIGVRTSTVDGSGPVNTSNATRYLTLQTPRLRAAAGRSRAWPTYEDSALSLP